jgi:hypothetical protein
MRSSTHSEHHEEDLKTLRKKYRASMNESARRTLDQSPPESQASPPKVTPPAGRPVVVVKARAPATPTAAAGNGYAGSAVASKQVPVESPAPRGRDAVVVKARPPPSSAAAVKNYPSSSSSALSAPSPVTKMPEPSSRSRIPSPSMAKKMDHERGRRASVSELTPPSSPPRGNIPGYSKSSSNAENPFRGLDLAPKSYAGSKVRDESVTRSASKGRATERSNTENDGHGRQPHNAHSPSRYLRKEREREVEVLTYEDEEEEEEEQEEVVQQPVNRGREGAYQRQQREQQEKLEQQQMQFLQQQTVRVCVGVVSCYHSITLIVIVLLSS